VIVLAVVVAHNLGLAERHKQALHIVSERNSEEVAVPIVVHTEAAGVVRAVRMVVAHTAVEVAVPNLAVAAGLDHKTWINPSRRIFIISHCNIRGNLQYHTTGVKANRQVSIRE